MSGKIFCIGFHKTGTTSLSVALKSLSYRVAGTFGVNDPDIADHVIGMACDLVEQYDAFQDNPWPVIYREMDERYPRSKFILTVRDPESWIKSQVKHFGREETPMRRWIYGVGCPAGNEHIYIGRFERHYREVREYFEGRPNDIVEMDLARGDGWEQLCGLLGREIPDRPFPHANQADDRTKRASIGARIARAAQKIAKRLTGNPAG